MRPVSSRTRTSVKPGARPSTSKCVTAAPAGRGVQRHALAVAQVPSDRRVYGARVLRQVAAEQRDVGAVDVAPLHGRDEAPVGLVAARHDQQPGRVLVEPVDDAGAHLVSAAGALGDEPLRERAVLVPRRRVHHHARRLVDDEQPVVLVDDGVGDVLRRQDHLGRRRSLPHHFLAGAQDVLLARRRPVEQHEAVGDQALGRGPAQPRVRGERDVEALAGVALRGAERVRVTRAGQRPPAARGRPCRRRSPRRRR